MAKINYSRCQIYVNGLDGMVCPCCGSPVISGVVHECSRPEKKAGQKTLPKRKP